MAQNRIIITHVEETEAKHLTVYDLLEMTEDDRQVVMEKAFALAANDTFEILEAFDNKDFNDGAQICCCYFGAHVSNGLRA